MPRRPGELHVTPGDPSPGTSGEMYLKAVFVLAEGAGEVIAARLAEFLGVSRASASAALRRLDAQRLLHADERHAIRLTPAGLATARTMVRRHRLFETWLIDTLRLPWEAAYHEACRLEHAISAQVEQRMYEALGRPASCPHGNPIADGAPPSAGVPLDTLTVGTAARVTSIGFPIEFRPEYLGYLEAHGVTPGTLLRVQEMPPQSDGRAVRIGDETMFLPSAVASAVRVRRTDAPEAAGR